MKGGNAVKTWVGRGEVGWGGVMSASVCACLFSSHNYSPRLQAGCTSYYIHSKRSEKGLQARQKMYDSFRVTNPM